MSSISQPAAVSAPFRGDRTAAGPLTAGQRNVLRWIGDENNTWSSVIPLFQSVPGGCSAAEVAAAVAVLIGRHEVLRTCYTSGDGDPVQHVHRDGELTAEVCEADGDDRAFVGALEARLSRRPFDLATELPVRAAIVTREHRPVLVVLVICHMAVDVGSIAVLRRELTALLAGAGAESLGRVAAQPLDVATAEQSAAGRRRAAVALRHWETRLAAAPLRLAVPAHAAQAVPRRVRMTSALAAEALDRLVQRSPAGHSATVLAAVAAVLGLRTGTDTCLLASVSGNRYHPGLGDYVGPLAQDALLSFGLAAATFDALVNQAWTAQLTAYRNSRFDATALWSIIEAVQHRRGQYFGRDWVFNDVGTHLDPGADEAVPAETRLEWTDVDHVPVMLFFRLIGVRPALDLELHFDARYFPPGDVEVLLRGVERLLAAAADTDISLTALADVTGCPPLDRGDGWIRSGSSWVDLAEVRRLLTDATDGAPCAVAAEPDGTITGYVAAAPCTDLRKIHLVCLALLPDRPAAATPTKYVLCDGPPEQTSDLDAWQARPVHAEGDAR